MSFLSNPFSTTRTKPRKYVSRSLLKLSADEMFRELGPKCETIDIRVADRKISYDIDQGEWNTGKNRFDEENIFIRKFFSSNFSRC